MTRSSGSRKVFLAGLMALCGLALVLLFILRGRETDQGGSLAGPPSSVDAQAPGPAYSLAVIADDSAQERGVVNPVDPPLAPDELSAKELALNTATAELTNYSALGLDGVIYVNEVLAHMLAYADLEIEDHPDLDYQDNDALAYKLKGITAGTEARVLVGLQPHDENGRRFRYLQMDIDIGVGKAEYMRDSVRDGPNVNLSVSYDETDPEVPTRFALLLQRRVSLSASKEAGIDAYHGKYTSGAYYWVDLLDNPPKLWTGTTGIVDGQPVDPPSFNEISPLAGDIELDKGLLAKLLKRLQQHRSTVKGQ